MDKETGNSTSYRRLQLLWLALIVNEFRGIACQEPPPVLPPPVLPPDIELEHNPELFTTAPERPRFMDPKNETPDYRIEEDTWSVNTKHIEHFFEFNRPYRISPHKLQINKFKKSKENPHNLGCYCTTVYRRLTLLAGCAVITTRHILTTASSTEMVLSRYRDNKHLTDILGAWYDDDALTYNSSNYMTPARIHYHPQWVRVEQVNHTHPLPFFNDLAVWAATYNFKGGIYSEAHTVVCIRGAPSMRAYLPTTPKEGDIALIVGFQFAKAFRKVPAPWFKYVVRADSFIQCPKTEWCWMHCLQGSSWGRYGIDSGAAWHRALPNKEWIYDGLIGMAAFSMRLRSEKLLHYFTVINSHPVLDFLYAAYTGRQPFEFLDWRFYNTQWRAPVQKPWSWIDRKYPKAETHAYYEQNLPFYK